MVGFELFTIATMLICDKSVVPLWQAAYRKIKAFVKRLKGCLAD